MKRSRISKCSANLPSTSSLKSNITANRLTLLPDFLQKRSAPFEGSKLRRSLRLYHQNNKEEEQGSALEKDLFASFKRPISLISSSFLKKSIEEEIQAINSVFTNSISVNNMSVNRKRGYSDDEKENYPMKFPYVPPSNWVFQTPPNRKLSFGKVSRKEETAIKPAVLETRDQKTVVYEMNSKINVDLSKCTSHQVINIDKRYMKEVTEDKDQLTSNELENHLSNLTCRPKKVFMPLPRIQNFKGKRDIFEDAQPSCSSSIEKDSSNVCFLDSLNSMEESFHFKFTSDKISESPTGRLFNFEGHDNTFNMNF